MVGLAATIFIMNLLLVAILFKATRKRDLRGIAVGIPIVCFTTYLSWLVFNALWSNRDNPNVLIAQPCLIGRMVFCGQ